MMEILQVAVNNLRSKFSNLVSEEYINKNYGLKPCNDIVIKSFNSIKLELIFVSNLEYVCLNQNQLAKVKAGNYKNLFKRKSYSGKMDNVELEDPVIINNITVVNNTITSSPSTNDEWLTTEF